jgi:SAM-dependent methyltransferase
MKLAEDPSWPEGRGSQLVQIAVGTFGILALELALIRWMSGQIRILAYLTNVILISAFLGMGVGLVVGRTRPGLRHATLPLLALLCIPLAFAERLGLTQMMFPDPSIHLWGAEKGAVPLLPALGAYLCILALVAAVVAVFVCAASPVGHLFARTAGLRAYSADLLGSLAGTLAAAAITALNSGPPVWLLIGAAPFLWLSRTVLSAAALVAVVALGQASVRGAIYSPYNRIDVTREGPALTLFVNRDFHQYMFDLSQPSGDELMAKVRTMYDLPYVLGEARGRALIVGAGTGNDAQAALRNGYRSVGAVDIDPRIVELGRRLHPERPYDDPRVSVVVDDGRAFFEQYRGAPFDVISYGLVDSHAMFSALSTLRLDNYLYTEEGLRAAWRHLEPGGVLAVNFSVAGGPWLRDRIYRTLARATGTQPVLVEHGLHQGALFVAAREPARLQWSRAAPFPVSFEPPATIRYARPTSDDWPFLYLRPGIVPWGYLIVLASILAGAVVLVVITHGARTLRAEFDWTLFLMGAGFLLIETRGVTSLSLLFGSTWVVNAAVFTGVLLMALLANLIVSRFRPASTLLPFLLLLLSVVLLWSIDLGALNRLPLLARGLAGGTINALPVAFAGVVVSTLLARSANMASALGANLLGSVLGGCLEYLSMYTGLRALALLALALYLGALAFHLRSLRSAKGVDEKWVLKPTATSGSAGSPRRDTLG